MHSTTSSRMSFWTFFVLAFLSLAAAASGVWTFEDAQAVVAAKGGKADAYKFSPTKPVKGAITLGSRDILKVSLTVKEGSQAGRPHQAFLLAQEPESKVETFFPLSVKELSGKAKIDLSHKDLPAFLLTAPSLSLSLVLGSFGESAASIVTIGNIKPSLDPTAKALFEKQKQKDLGEGATVYKAKDEIRHIFRADPQSPPKIITLFFLLSVLAGLGGLFIVWFPILGGNLSHLPKALKAAPVSHPFFFASLLSLEGIFFMYYTQWNLFQTLAGMAVVGPVALFSGSRALREVRARREKGER
ncbi:Oligosaccharyltransferase subunit Ribophorin II-domain-containing protein [Tuber borchii]|uniref:Oligosaccharyltransferase subunit Ribophorin II-domain-containing protein n=1 Tax=Tuber borchii TaxID=42251 RepID=A0A2T6Z9S8_TUBBO|nr:Oligosaccharyltransferase subunit Ribophorin II-domain-containing protein [Tuber borchii]